MRLSLSLPRHLCTTHEVVQWTFCWLQEGALLMNQPAALGCPNPLQASAHSLSLFLVGQNLRPATVDSHTIGACEAKDTKKLQGK